MDDSSSNHLSDDIGRVELTFNEAPNIEALIAARRAVAACVSVEMRHRNVVRYAQ